MRTIRKYAFKQPEGGDRHTMLNESSINTPAMPLSMVTPGATVELVQIVEGKRLRKRLADLGLNVGLNIRVIQNCFSGPLIVAVKEDSRLALGRGMAHHILVIPSRKSS